MRTKHEDEAPVSELAPDRSPDGSDTTVRGASLKDTPTDHRIEEQALIEEARQRQRRRRRWIAATLVVVLGAGLGIGLAIGGPATNRPLSHHVSTVPASIPTTLLAAGTPVSATTISLVSFVDDLHGFGVVGPANQPSALHQLATSSDGGRTWHAVGAALPQEPSTAPAYNDQEQGSFTFVSQTTGYIVSCCNAAGISVIYGTLDGGLHWSALTPAAPDGSPTLVNPLFIATSGTSLWALGASSCSPPAATQPLCHMSVLASDDSGTSWKTLPLPIDVAEIFAVSRPSPLDAAILVEATSGGPSRLLVTTDGGTSWSVSDGPSCTAATPTALVVFGSEDIALCEGSRPDNQGQGQFWATTDAGKIWTLKASLSEGTVSPAAESMGAEITVDDGIIWAALPHALYRSDDGGSTWTNVGVNAGRAAWGGQVTFVDSQHGWLVYLGAGLWRTSDAGSTWSPVATRR